MKRGYHPLYEVMPNNLKRMGFFAMLALILLYLFVLSALVGALSEDSALVWLWFLGAPVLACFYSVRKKKLRREWLADNMALKESSDPRPAGEQG